MSARSTISRDLCTLRTAIAGGEKLAGVARGGERERRSLLRRLWRLGANAPCVAMSRDAATLRGCATACSGVNEAAGRAATARSSMLRLLQNHGYRMDQGLGRAIIARPASEDEIADFLNCGDFKAYDHRVRGRGSALLGYCRVHRTAAFEQEQANRAAFSCRRIWISAGPVASSRPCRRKYAL